MAEFWTLGRKCICSFLPSIHKLATPMPGLQLACLFGELEMPWMGVKFELVLSSAFDVFEIGENVGFSLTHEAEVSPVSKGTFKI